MNTKARSFARPVVLIFLIFLALMLTGFGRETVSAAEDYVVKGTFTSINVSQLEDQKEKIVTKADVEKLNKPERVVIESGVLSLGKLSFDYGPKVIVIPASVTHVNSSAFPKGTIVCCHKGSHAESIALKNGNTVHILPGKASFTATGENSSIVLAFTRAGTDSACEIQYRPVGGKNWTDAESSKASHTIGKLTNKKEYQIRIRERLDSKGLQIYGPWTDAVKAYAGVDIMRATLKGLKNFTYSGKNVKQKLTLEYNGKSYTPKLKYSKNRKSIGVHYVTLTCKELFYGSRKEAYKILPRKTAIKKLQSEYSYDEKRKTDRLNRARVIIKKLKGGVRYQYAYRSVGKKGWQILDSKKTEKLIKNLVQGRVYQVRARGYKKVNGEYYYGKWSKAGTVSTKETEMENYYVYRTDTKVRGTVTNIMKGYKVIVTIGKKKYTKTFGKSKDLAKFAVKTGKHKAGTKFKLTLVNVYNQAEISYTDVIYYAKSISTGMTGAQVRLCPGWENPSRTGADEVGAVWYYNIDGSEVKVYFDKDGRVSEID